MKFKLSQRLRPAKEWRESMDKWNFEVLNLAWPMQQIAFRWAGLAELQRLHSVF